MRRFALALLCLLVAMSLAPWSWSQTATYAYQSPLVIFITVTTSNGFHISGSSAAFHVLTWNNTGTVTTCQIQADGSADGITWGNGDVIASTLCTSNGTVTSASDVVNYIRINITAISGAGATVSARLTGYINNPAGAAGTVTHTSGALTANQVVLGNGAADLKVDTGLSTNGSGAVTSTTGGIAFTHTPGTITTSNPTRSHTVTWNAGGVAFTNGLSNITCTAAATASIALGLGTSGTQWQFKYNGANCANPQLIMPAGTALNPALTAGSSTGVFFLPASGV